MHVGHHYPFGQVLRWTRRDIARHTLVAALFVACYTWLGWRWLAVPWLPIALLGTAVAFVVSFKNNASYDRLWEARRTLCHRHFAWLTALRYQLREPRPWESVAQPHNAEYKQRWFRVDEHERPVAPALAAYLAPDEHMRVMASANKATRILALQSDHLATLRRAGWIEDFRHMELQRVLGELFAQQGASERIKNFLYPRQYATLNLWFVHIFVVLIPLGMLQEFEKLGGALIWLLVPFSTLAAWIFTTMEKIGESTESPFEGSANDVPITAMSRTIEIDLRQMLGDTDVPPAIGAQNDILL